MENVRPTGDMSVRSDGDDLNQVQAYSARKMVQAGANGTGPKQETSPVRPFTSVRPAIYEAMKIATDRPRPATPHYQCDRVSVPIMPEFALVLSCLAHNQGVGLAAVLIGGWVAFLCRWSGQDEGTVGIAPDVLCVDTEQMCGTIGALRVNIRDVDTVESLLRNVDAELLNMRAGMGGRNGTAKYTAAESNSSDEITGGVLAGLNGRPTGANASVDGSSLRKVNEDPETGVSRTAFDLALLWNQTDGQLIGTLEYASDLFEKQTIDRMVACLKVFLAAMADDIRRPLTQVPMLPDEQRHLVVTGFNATRTLYERGDRLVHELFEEQVARTPNLPALQCEGRTLTYSELNTKANALARYLRDRGVGPDQPVGICVQRSLEMVIGLLGILKAGGAYVPLDPDYPAERLEYMLEDAAPRVLLIQERLRARLPRTDAQVVALDEQDFPLENVSNLTREVTGVGPHHLAYIIYTSGSTGRPKGAMNEHRGVVNRLLWMQDAYQIGIEDRILQKTPFSFDVSVWEFFWTLMTGARLVIARPEGHRDPAYLHRVIEESGITTAHFVPSMLQAFLDHHQGGPRSSLRHLVCSGEELSASLQTRYLQRFPEVKLSNLYGPTEAAVDVTAWECQRGEPCARVPIGRPISNVQIYLLGTDGEPVPVGVTGEIYIAGIGVGRGYLNRPELTAEKFLRDPFSISPARMYRTGDLGRWRADGSIEYLGRNDHQVKIRGLRIELGEIEAQLAQHPQVKEVAVLVREDVPGEKRLVAYVTADTSARNSLEPHATDFSGTQWQQELVVRLRKHLMERLPPYMVPGSFLILESLPLTPNGKLDRRALTALGVGIGRLGGFDPPRGETEEALAGIWAEMFNLDRVGRQDNFFELGGHSLLVVEMMERARQANLGIDVRAVFQSATLGELARTVKTTYANQIETLTSAIPDDCDEITPQMLPLVTLDAGHIQGIVQKVPGGARNIQDIYPLAPLQEGMLFHHLLTAQGGDAYVLPTLLQVASRERVQDFLNALQETINRHDVLRTAIMWEGLPKPVQVVSRRVSLPVEELHLKEDGGLNQMLELMKPEHQKMDLALAPLIRVQIGQDSLQKVWYVLFQIHHLVCDNNSLQAILHEVFSRLNGVAASTPASAPYRLHVEEALQHAKTTDPEKFFRRKLADVDEPTIPFGLRDVHGDGSRIEQNHQLLAPDLAHRARQQARRLGVSVATLFHAAWALVLARTTGRNDVVFGSVLLGRMQGGAGARGILGMFINTLPLRLQLVGLSAKDLVTTTQREIVDLLEYEQASLALAQRCSGVGGEGPLFNSILNYRHGVIPSSHARAAGVTLLASESRTNYPIMLSVDDLGDSLGLSMDTDRQIEPGRILGYVIEGLRSLVDALADAPDTLALTLQIVPYKEQRTILWDFNDTVLPRRDERSIHEVFERQASRSPSSLAVEYEGEHLSYAELNVRANRVAGILRRHGIGSGGLVAICMERSLEMVIGLLGILKAGGAYLPVDPNYPRERISYMLQDAAPKVILTQERLVAGLGKPSGATLVLDAKTIHAPLNGEENLTPRPSPGDAESLVYVIYTSGSTGQPKGTAMGHRAMVNLIDWHERTFGDGYGHRVLQFAALSFDVAFQEIFTTLCTGGTLVLINEWIRKDARALLAFLGAQLIDRLFVPPLMLQSMAECFRSTSIRPGVLHDVITAGEQLRITPEMVHFFESMPDSRLHNHYGPTETHVVTALTLTGRPREWPLLPPIGRPITNCQIYVLDEQRQVVPLNVPGEIYIGGAGLAQGYFQRPELTAQRFVQSPLRDVPGQRLYRTGDLGKWNPDGELEYLGRNDDQVKIRGYRIELGEIEARLARQEAVKEAAVVAREDLAGQKRLIAYVTLKENKAVTVNELRVYLTAQLPDYMVPAGFVVLDRLPLTPSGKLDRKALPAPEITAYGDRDYEPPRGEVEEILAAIWGDLLKIEQVGRNDNFFELGGHSLLIVQMMERLRQRGLFTEVRRVFQSPVLASLARQLISGESGQDGVPPNLIPPDCVRITPEMLPLVELTSEEIERVTVSVSGGAGNIQDIYPLAPLQEGILFHHLLNPNGRDAYVLPTLFSVSSKEGLVAFTAALQRVIDRHDVLRTAVLWELLPRPLQVVQRRATLPVEELTLDGHRNPIEELRERMATENYTFDMRKPPLMRLQVAPNPHDGKWLVLLLMHHIVCDHESLEAMFAETMAHVAGVEGTLPTPEAYRNHVAQSLSHARTHDPEEFFRLKLGDVEEPTAPFGLLEARGDGSGIVEHRLPLESTLSKRARDQARRLGMSPATLFHAAWALVVAHTSGRDDVVFGNVLLGRLQGSAGARRILGMFINTLPLRIKLKQMSILRLAEHTQRELVDLLSQEQASLAIAQRCSALEPGTPLFTALFNYRHTAAALESELVSVAGVKLIAEIDRTNYPITLSIDDLGKDFLLTAQTDQRVDPQRLTEYMRTALEATVDALEREPTKDALSISIMPLDERRQVVHAFNATNVSYPKDRLVHELFEDQVLRTPEAIAVVSELGALSYAELNRKSDLAADHLRQRGVEVGEYVPILMARSADMLIAQLAVLKCGGVYVPIDPRTPAERKLFIIQDCDARRVITDQPVDEIGQAPVQWVDSSELMVSTAMASNEVQIATDSALSPAYVMYTSGSTGAPKGVVVPHRAIIRLVVNAGYVQLSADDCLSHSSNPAFDASTFEIWAALLNGGRILLLSHDVVLDPQRFSRALRENRVTILWMTIGLFSQYADALGEVFGQLKYVLVGGDVLDLGAVRRVISGRPPSHMLNAYGPTECTTFSTTQEIQGITEHDTSVPIGRPISNTQCYILNRRMQPVHIGVPGEIYIGGDGLALGYLNRPELTADRFVANPFAADQGGRLYKTGDLGRWRSDGAIEYLGRNDKQVKIRGFRVELGEIEAHLRRHSQVKDAQVVVREDVPGQRRLVAYVIPATDREGEPNLDVRALRGHLVQSVPEYMVPAVFMALEAFPLTPNGKLDRRALPSPVPEAIAQRSYEAPLDSVEQLLAEVWQQILGVKRAGREDDFFELGGHSLLAIRAVSQINRRLGSALQVADLYKSRTLRELRARVVGRASVDQSVDLSVEARLDPDIAGLPGVPQVPAGTVLLTGCTGFVGRFLLAELLRESSAKIHCLVRAPFAEEALSRIRGMMQKWDLWSPEWEGRIKPIVGDLRSPRLGLGDATYDLLCEEVDAIYHCGTSMNHLETYAMARAANVEGTKELLRIASRGRTKVVNFISTLSVFASFPAGAPRTVNESSNIDAEIHLNSQGYAASKWVGEKLVQVAGQRGLACNIFRLGLVWADSKLGRYDELQREYRLFKSCLLSGYGIKDYRFELPPTPVDYVARSVVHLANQYNSGGGVFHISSPSQMVGSLFERYSELCREPLVLLPRNEWVAKVTQFSAGGRVLPIAPLLEGVFQPAAENPLKGDSGTTELSALRYECTRTHGELESAGIMAPIVDDTMLRTYISSMFARDPDLYSETGDVPECGKEQYG